MRRASAVISAITLQALVSRDPRALTAVSAAICAIAGIALPGYGRDVRMLLLPAAMLLVAAIVISSMHKRHSRQTWEFLSANVIFGALLAFCFMWVRNDGFPFILSGRESFLTYLAAYNTRDFSTFLIQDIAIGAGETAHPFYYLNHPNFPSRLVSLLAQTAGFDLRDQLLLAMCISAIGLACAYLAFRSHISSAFALAFILFIATSYAAFFPKAFDLLWSINIVLFWCFLFLLFRDSTLDRRATRLALPVIMFLISLSDWGLFVFLLAFSTYWLAYYNRSFPMRRYAWLVLAPCAIGVTLYAVTIIHAVGLQVFITNVNLNLLSRLGQLGAISLDGTAVTNGDVTTWLRNHNVAVLPRPAVVVTISDFVGAYWTATRTVAGHLALPLGLVGLMSIVYFLLRIFRGARLIALAALSTALVLLSILPPIFLLLAAGCFLKCLLQRGRSDFGHHRSVRLRVVTWISLAFAALITAFAVLPSYTVNNTLNPAGMNIPAGLVEASIFAGLIAFFIGQLEVKGKLKSTSPNSQSSPPSMRLLSASFKPHIRQAALLMAAAAVIGFLVSITLAGGGEHDLWQALTGAVAVLSLFAVFYPRTAFVFYPRTAYRGLKNLQTRLQTILRKLGLARIAAVALASLIVMLYAHLKWNFDLYVFRGPDPYPFSATLSDKQYAGRSFVTNNDDAAVWYFTKGWSYSISSSLPIPGFEASQTYFADWTDTVKYSRPEFYLCDYGQFTTAINKSITNGNETFRDCMEVAEFLSEYYFYRIIISTAEFAVVALQ